MRRAIEQYLFPLLVVNVRGNRAEKRLVASGVEARSEKSKKFTLEQFRLGLCMSATKHCQTYVGGRIERSVSANEVRRVAGDVHIEDD